MTSKTRLLGLLASLAAAIGVASHAGAQTVNGVLGSPSATSTIPGNQLPARWRPPHRPPAPP